MTAATHYVFNSFSRTFHEGYGLFSYSTSIANGVDA